MLWSDALLLMKRPNVYEVVQSVGLLQNALGHESGNEARAQSMQCKLQTPLPVEICLCTIARDERTVPQQFYNLEKFLVEIHLFRMDAASIFL